VFQRIKSWWFDLQQGLWFVPCLMTAAAAMLAFVMIRIDQEVLANRSISSWWVFDGGAEGARGVLTAIAGTMITVATTVFSITIVALQLGASQFSPRILRGFTRDRGNQLVLGTFIATFVYTLLVLRSVQSATADIQVFVPAASVSVAILLAITAIGSLIFYLHHATRTIQASVVIDRAASDTFDLLQGYLEDHESAGTAVAAELLAPGDLITIDAGRSGYVTAIDTEALLALAGTHQIVISITASVGQHVLSSTPLAAISAVWRSTHPDDDHNAVHRRIRQAFVIEIERTLEHDVLLGFRQLSDIAIKALSPGINDPTTAVTCIDRLGEALLQARCLRSQRWFRAVPDAHSGIVQPSIGFDDIVDECLPQIRHYAAGDAVVVRHLLEVLEEVADCAEGDVYDALANQARLLVEEAAATLSVSSDRRAVGEAGRWATR
jgi:uncharacterized membrane protein